MIVKVCGITNVDDARFALEVGADWVGLNLLAGPRRIDMETATSILTKLDDPSRAVILIRIDDLDDLTEQTQGFLAMGVRRLQLYGEAAPEAVGQLADAGFDAILLVRIEGRTSFDAFDDALSRCGQRGPEFALIDSAVEGKLGGTGRVADWDLIRAARESGRFSSWPPLMLAGGLTPDNVSEAIRIVRPAGVDVSSGVESSPGQKDGVKVAEFVKAAGDLETGLLA